MQPTEEQLAAIDAMEDFLENGSGFFLLSGRAGTGKTTCIRALADRIRGRLIFTAPTNKATKVLRDMLTTKDYKPECRTIYSLLGLRMEANGEVKELMEPEDPVELGAYRGVVVDEASMINSALWGFIQQTATMQGVCFIFLGDAAQLPPVGEPHSPIWEAAHDRAELRTVMRHDNEILALATDIRAAQGNFFPKINIASGHNGEEGVWRLSAREFELAILEAAGMGQFSVAGAAKAIAWRNATVDALNIRIRRRIFDNAAQTPWLVEDRVILTGPAKDLDSKIVGTTDDEGVVTLAEEAWHPVWPEYKIWTLGVTTDDNRTMRLMVLHADSVRDYERKVAELAAAARRERRLWKDFWEFKESFHGVRHAYAITAHRSQGSTYDTAFVDWRDILVNQNRLEAFQCLYVACTRPKRRLILN